MNKTNHGRILKILTAAALVFSMAGCGKDKYTAKLEEAAKLLQAGNYEQAIKTFKVAIDIDPKKTDAYFQLAEAYAANQDYEQALTTYDDILAIDATNTDAMIGQADVLLDENDASDALAKLRDSAAKSKDQKITDKLNEVLKNLHGIGTTYQMDFNAKALAAAVQQVYLDLGCKITNSNATGGFSAFEHMKIKIPVHPTDTVDGGDSCDSYSGNYFIRLNSYVNTGQQAGFDIEIAESSATVDTTEVTDSEILYTIDDTKNQVTTTTGMDIKLNDKEIDIIISSGQYNISYLLGSDNILTETSYFSGPYLHMSDVNLNTRHPVYNADGSYADENARAISAYAKQNLPSYLDSINAALNAYSINLKEYLNIDELTRMING